MAFEFISQAPRPQKIILGVFGLVVLVAGGFFLLLSPKSLEVRALRDQRAVKQADLLQSKAVAASLARFKEEAKGLRAKLETAKGRLPSQKEIPGLYRQVSDLAFQSGLSVSLFQPKDLITKDIYEEVPITVNGEASYHQLGSFFYQLSRLSRIINLTDLKLTGIARPTGTVRADLVLTTYVFRPEGAPPPVTTGVKR